MHRFKSVFFSSLIVFVSIAILYLLATAGHVFLGFFLFTLCIVASYPLYYEKLTKHPNLIIALSTPLVLVYSIVAFLIRYGLAGKLHSELVWRLCLMIAMYVIVFMVIYSVLYAVIAWLLRRFNF